MRNKVVIGTRTSKLALYQTHKVKKELKKIFTDLVIGVLEVKTKGDIILVIPILFIRICIPHAVAKLLVG